jgi:hypothetical protein
MTKSEDLRFAAQTWVQMFGARLPISEDELNVELFQQASEQANVVTFAIRRHGYRDFRATLEQLISEQRGATP